jgi:hypothetical protein
MILDDHRMRSVVESQRFAEELQRLRPDPVRADDFADGAKWVLSRNPEVGTKIGKSVWFLPMSIGNAIIYYTFDDDRVDLLSIQATVTLGEESS